MPRKFTSYEPDAIDCHTLEMALARDFYVLPELVTRYSADHVIVVCKCRKLSGGPEAAVECQALQKRFLKQSGSLFVMHYGVLLDCWHQLDRGVLGLADRPIERGWDGRPRAPWRHT